NLIAEAGTGTLGSGDRVGLIYATSTGGINFARSTNGALSFTNVAVSPASSADTTPAFPVVASAGNGSLHAVWVEVCATASARIGSVPVTSGPICTQGTGCSADRELLDFQSVALDGAGRANAVWTRSIDGVSDTEIRFARQ